MRHSIALAGGTLSILITTYGISIDRLQSMTNQWLALAIYFSIKVCKGRNIGWSLFGLAASLFLLVHGSIYTSVILLSVAPFLLPLLFTGKNVSRFWKKVGVLALAALGAAAITALTMLPWLSDRWDMGAYSQKEFLEIKRWHSALLGPLVRTPPELEKAITPLMPPSRFDGYYPGHAVLMTLFLALALPAGARFLQTRRKLVRQPPTEVQRTGMERLFRAATASTCVFGIALLVVFAAWVLGIKQLSFQGLVVDFLIWGLLLSWIVRLACWDMPWNREGNTIAFLASTALLIATILFLSALGSPIRLFINGPEIADGIFRIESMLIPPLGQLRFLYRIVALASWFFVLALFLRLELGTRFYPKWVALPLSALLIFTSMVAWVGGEFWKVRHQETPPGYQLLAESTGTGGLVELPVANWNSNVSVFRMLWQREHGRPIVAGMNSQAPPWYRHAREVLNSFPSRECLWLMRRWNIDTALVGSPSPYLDAGARRSEQEISLRGSIGQWTLYDTNFQREAREFDTDRLAGSLAWEVPITRAEPELQESLGDDITFYRNAVSMESDETLNFEIESGRTLRAVMIDYGYGIGANIPSRIKVLGRVDGRWVDLTSEQSGRFLRARAADLLMRRRPARLVIAVSAANATQFRLQAYRRTWHIPELRVSHY